MGQSSPPRAPRGHVISLLEVAGLLFLVLAAVLVWRPFARSHRIEANEIAAQRTLEEIAVAQRRFRERSPKAGFASLAELLGEDQGRKGSTVRPALLDPSTFEKRGKEYVREGYVFVVYLATAEKRARRYPEDRRQDYWIAYAWPEHYARSGRAILVRSMGREVSLHHNRATRYDGVDDPPPGNLFHGRDSKMPFPAPPIGLQHLEWSRWSHPQH